MRSQKPLAILLRGGVPSLLVAATLSGPGPISVQVWLATAGVWVVGTLLWDFVVSARVEPDGRSAVVRISKRTPRRVAHGPQGVRVLSLLLRNAQSNPRIHVNALRPRLMALAQHYVPIRHGFDPERDKARASRLLGDVAWLVDPAITERSPTSTEIEAFLHIVMQESAQRPTAPRTYSPEVTR